MEARIAGLGPPVRLGACSGNSGPPGQWDSREREVRFVVSRRGDGGIE